MRKNIFTLLFYIFHPIIFLRNLVLTLTCAKVRSRKLKNQEDKVSVIIVTYNALGFIKLCLNSLIKTKYKNKEVIVVDNNSAYETRKYLREAKKRKLIDELYLSSDNTFFTGGNNIGASITSKNSKYLILLNSDIEIKNTDWLSILMANKPERGIVSFGKVDIPVIRPDGWCFMVDKRTYKEIGGLNEYYKMNWSITEFTAKVLQRGYTVKSIINPNKYIYHFGQKSHTKKKTVLSNQMNFSQVMQLFKGFKIDLLKI